MANGGTVGPFLQELQEYSKDKINDEMIELLEPYVTAPDYNITVRSSSD